jgi:hypothetical protein
MDEKTVLLALIWASAAMLALWLVQAVWHWLDGRQEPPRVEQPEVPQPSWVAVDMARARQTRARRHARGSW